MNDENLIKIEEVNGSDVISINNIPNIVSEKITYITELEEKVIESEKSAAKAMELAANMKRFKEHSFLGIKWRSGNKKDIIENTQECVESLANAQQVSVDALKKSFEFQIKLAEISKFLLGIGCSNIAANRTAINAIREKLSYASRRRLSDNVRQELLSIVRQLNEQKDIFERIDSLSKKVEVIEQKFNLLNPEWKIENHKNPRTRKSNIIAVVISFIALMLSIFNVLIYLKILNF